ncbi:sugar phosphate isomerase/epimerase (plasmid) [Rhizobium sp. L51/94]|nr:sugar phosphate isomerase/epimerase [Rhizobium sp. L51/94]
MDMYCMTVWHPDHGDRWYDEGVRNSLRLIKDAGFTHINWNPDSGSSYVYAPSEIRFITEIVANAGLKTHTIHASNGRNKGTEWSYAAALETRKDIASAHKWQREAGIDLLINRVDLAAAMNAPNMVLHVDIDAFDPSGRGANEEFYGYFFESLDAVRPYCLEKNVAIAVENIFGGGINQFVDFFENLFSRYEPDFVGLCYDSGHSRVIDPDGFTLLERFRSRLIATHLHDNRGAKDDHLLPFDGVIDWQKTMSLIADSPYELPLNFETPFDRYSLKEYPFYEKAMKAAVQLHDMVLDARRSNSRMVTE